MTRIAVASNFWSDWALVRLSDLAGSRGPVVQKVLRVVSSVIEKLPMRAFNVFADMVENGLIFVSILGVASLWAIDIKTLKVPVSFSRDKLLYIRSLIEENLLKRHRKI